MYQCCMYAHTSPVCKGICMYGVNTLLMTEADIFNISIRLFQISINVVSWSSGMNNETLLLCACCYFTALLGCLFFVLCHVDLHQSPPNKPSPKEKLLISWLCFDLSFSFSLQSESSSFDRRQKRPGCLRLVRTTHFPLFTLINAQVEYK